MAAESRNFRPSRTPEAATALSKPPVHTQAAESYSQLFRRNWKYRAMQDVIIRPMIPG
jgi:hypothetical protein